MAGPRCSSHGEGTKQLIPADAGPLVLECPASIVDGQPDLSMVVYHPPTDLDCAGIAKLLQGRKKSRVPKTL